MKRDNVYLAAAVLIGTIAGRAAYDFVKSSAGRSGVLTLQDDHQSAPDSAPLVTREADREPTHLPAASVLPGEPSNQEPGAFDRPDGQGMEAGLTSLLSSLEVSFQPTPEGLLARTTELWSTPDFLDLTQEEFEQMLPTEDGMVLPTNLLDFIGSDLPTLDDCRIGLQDPETRRLLEILCIEEATYSELCEMPYTRRGPLQDAVIQAARDRRYAAEGALMQRLDQTTTYKNWRLLARLYHEWEK